MREYRQWQEEHPDARGAWRTMDRRNARDRVNRALKSDGENANADKRVSEYIRALKAEISERADSYAGRTIGSIFFGGGTPSVIDAKYINEIH